MSNILDVRPWPQKQFFGLASTLWLCVYRQCGIVNIPEKWHEICE